MPEDESSVISTSILHPMWTTRSTKSSLTKNQAQATKRKLRRNLSEGSPSASTIDPTPLATFETLDEASLSTTEILLEIKTAPPRTKVASSAANKAKGKQKGIATKDALKQQRKIGRPSKNTKAVKTLYQYGFTSVPSSADNPVRRSHVDAESKKVDFSGSYVSTAH